MNFCIFTPGYFSPKFRLPREYRISGYIFNFLSTLAWSRLDLWKTAGFMWLFSWPLPKVSHLKVFVAHDQLLYISAAPWKSWKCDRFADKHILYLMCIIFFAIIKIEAVELLSGLFFLLSLEYFDLEIEQVSH